MSKYIKLFNNKKNFKNFVNQYYDDDTIITYVENDVNDNPKLYYNSIDEFDYYNMQFRRTVDEYCTFVSKLYNLKVPNNLKAYAAYQVQEGETANKYKLTFLKTKYIKAGIPYILKIVNRNPNNTYRFTRYTGQIDISNILQNDTYFAPIYNLTKVQIGKYYQLYADTWYYCQSFDVTETYKKPLFSRLCLLGDTIEKPIEFLEEIPTLN